MSIQDSPQFYTYSNGQFHKADVTKYFGGQAKSAADIVSAIKSLGFESMTRGDLDAGEVTFSLWEGPGHQCVARITTDGVAPHIIYLDGLLNWLEFQGHILSPALSVSRHVHGDA